MRDACLLDRYEGAWVTVQSDGATAEAPDNKVDTAGSDTSSSPDMVLDKQVCQVY